MPRALDTDFDVPDGPLQNVLSTFFMEHEVGSKPQHESTRIECDWNQFQPTQIAYPVPRTQSTTSFWPNDDGQIGLGQGQTAIDGSVPCQPGLPYQSWRYPQYQKYQRIPFHTSTHMQAEENVQAPYQFVRAVEDEILRTTGFQHMNSSSPANILTRLDDDGFPRSLPSSNVPSNPCFQSLTPLTAHSMSHSSSPLSPSTWQTATTPARSQKRALDNEEEKAERIAKQSRIEAVVYAEEKLYEENKEKIERFCSKKQEYIKAKWFVKLHAWKEATGMTAPTKRATPYVETPQHLSNSTLTSRQPDTVVRDAIANGKRPDTIRHPHDKVRVPEYPTDDDIETCALTTTGRYRCTHEFGNLKCCNEGLDRAGKLSSINKQLNTWRAKVERLIQKKELHASHKTWDRWYDSELRKKKLGVQVDVKSVARAAEAAHVEAQTAMQQADVASAAPACAAIVPEHVTTPAVETVIYSLPPQVHSGRKLSKPEPVMNFRPAYSAPELYKQPTPLLWLDGSVCNLGEYLANPWPLDNDYDRFLVGEQAADGKMTKSFFKFFYGQVPVIAPACEPSTTSTGKRNLDAFLADHQPAAGRVDKVQKIAQPTVVHAVEDPPCKPTEGEDVPDKQVVGAASNDAGVTYFPTQDTKPISPIVDTTATPTAEKSTTQAVPTSQQTPDSELLTKLRQHDRLHRDALYREKRKKWPKFELLEEWWSASRRREQGLSLTPEEHKLLERAEPSWGSDKHPMSGIDQLGRQTMAEAAADQERAEQGTIDDDNNDLGSLFDDDEGYDSLFGDDDEL